MRVRYSRELYLYQWTPQGDGSQKASGQEWATQSHVTHLSFAASHYHNPTALICVLECRQHLLQQCETLTPFEAGAHRSLRSIDRRVKGPFFFTLFAQICGIVFTDFWHRFNRFLALFSQICVIVCADLCHPLRRFVSSFAQMFGIVCPLFTHCVFCIGMKWGRKEVGTLIDQCTVWAELLISMAWMLKQLLHNSST